MDNNKKRFQHEVQEARELLEFAVSEGFTSEDGRRVDDSLIEAIQQAEDIAHSEEPPRDEQRAAFEKAYRDLSLLMSPVTVKTLRATSTSDEKIHEAYRRRSLLAPWRKVSEATIWSRTLWSWTFLLITIALFGEVLKTVLAPAPPVDEAAGTWPSFWYLLNTVLQILVPFTYGGLGAAAYLLRSAHIYIYKRQFNPLRKPEYYNRMLLGIVSGGAIMLFITRLTTEEGAIYLSAAALGFIAGYNTDFLFATIERIIAAILPKVGPETVRRTTRTTSVSMSVTGTLSLQDLLDRYHAVQTDEEKKLYLSLIEKLKDRV